MTIGIIGGGLVGQVCGLMLAKQNHAADVHLIDNSPSTPTYHTDGRGIALNLASQRMLAALGVWDTLAKHACPIEHVHVSERGRWGQVHWHAKDNRVRALGYLVEYPVLQQAIAAHARDAGVVIHQPACFNTIQPDSEGWQIHYTQADSRHQLHAQCLIGADGVKSPLAQALGVTGQAHDYQHQALIRSVQTNRSHQNRAYERFFDQQTMALLPMNDGRFKLVWTGSNVLMQSLSQATPDVFIERFSEAFGYRAGRITELGKPQCIPLTRFEANACTGHNWLLLGNAANTIHPVAAQGLNFAYRDIARLHDVLKPIDSDQALAPQLKHALKEYTQWRQADEPWLHQLSHGLISLFNSPCKQALPTCRSLGMWGLNMMPPLKRALCRQFMGLYGTVPSLACHPEEDFDLDRCV